MEIISDNKTNDRTKDHYHNRECYQLYYSCCHFILVFVVVVVLVADSDDDDVLCFLVLYNALFSL